MSDDFQFMFQTGELKVKLFSSHSSLPPIPHNIIGIGGSEKEEKGYRIKDNFRGEREFSKTN